MARLCGCLTSAMLLLLLSLCTPLHSSAALSSGPAGHVLSSSLQVFGNVTLVDSAGATKNLLEVIQRQEALISQLVAAVSALTANASRVLPSTIVFGTPSTLASANSVERPVIWPASAVTHDSPSSYDPTTGVWLAPESAVYLVQVSLGLANSGPLSLQFYIDSVLVRNNIVSTYALGGQVSSLTAHVVMKKGQSLHFTMQANAGAGAGEWAPITAAENFFSIVGCKFI